LSLSSADRLSRLFVIAAHDDAGVMRGLAAVGGKDFEIRK
jgi:hypothetical protein